MRRHWKLHHFLPHGQRSPERKGVHHTTSKHGRKRNTFYGQLSGDNLLFCELRIEIVGVGEGQTSCIAE